MSLLAVETVSEADCVSWMATRPNRSRARDTAAQWIPDSARTLEFVLPMSPDPARANRVYRSAASDISRRLDDGDKVACLCEGDPLFYGSFMYLHAILDNRYPVRIVPGIPSLSAAAAALSQPLAARDDRLAVIPASLGDDEIEHALDRFETVVFLKVGRHLSRLQRILGATGRDAGAALVENASLPGAVACSLREAPPTVSYFSMIVVRQGKAASL